MTRYLENLYRQVYLVYPHAVPSRVHLCPLMAYIANQIPELFGVNLLIRDRKVFEADHQQYFTRSIELFEVPLSDIWLGDFFPYRIDEENVFSFRYLENLTDQRRLMEALEIEVDEVPLLLDLGSFEMIGEVLLVSTDIYDLNRLAHGVAGVNAILHEYFDPAAIIVVESPTRLTHLDTMFRVFDNIVLFNPRHVTGSTVRLVAGATKDYGYQFHEMPFELSGEVNCAAEGHIESYVGNPFDFLVLDTHVLFPIVQPTDENNCVRLGTILQEMGNTKTLLPLRHPAFAELYRLGGGLFCISGIC